MSTYKMVAERYPKMLVADSKKCNSCGRCVLACSFKHSKVFNPSKSRIHIIRIEHVDSPIICLHCGLCILACPIEAIKRNRNTGAVIIDEDKCNGCGQCLSSCPLGVITLDHDRIKAIKCDLCDGNPACVAACAFNALRFEIRDRAIYYRQMQAALK